MNDGESAILVSNREVHVVLSFALKQISTDSPMVGLVGLVEAVATFVCCFGVSDRIHNLLL